MQSVSITRHTLPSEPLPSNSVFLRHIQAFYKRSPKYVNIIGDMLFTWPRYELKVVFRRVPSCLAFLTNFIVKKNAEAQRDRLGPQWPSWVTKAVHRLVSLCVASVFMPIMFVT